MTFVYNDGGRKAAGYTGTTRDCVVRAVAIAAQMPYLEAYNGINTAARYERPGMKRSRSSARTGVHLRTLRRYMASLGWRWTPTMHIGSGCRVHLRADELPPGMLIVSVSRHVVAVIDGVIHDTHDPSRAGKRCVYGFFQE